MATMFTVTKVEKSKTRRLPLLPRVGIVVEVAGRKFTFRSAPLLETALNLKDRGVSLAGLRAVIAEELGEIRFPSLERGLAAVRDLAPKAVLKKRPVKAAARKRAEKSEAPAT